MFMYLRKLFGMTIEESAEVADRVYHFQLPYRVVPVYLHYGISQLKSEGVWRNLPKELTNKWESALKKWHDVKITKADLDTIDNLNWTKIAKKLGLKWENKKK